MIFLYFCKIVIFSRIFKKFSGNIKTYDQCFSGKRNLISFSVCTNKNLLQELFLIFLHFSRFLCHYFSTIIWSKIFKKSLEGMNFFGQYQKYYYCFSSQTKLNHFFKLYKRKSIAKIIIDFLISFLFWNNLQIIYFEYIFLNLIFLFHHMNFFKNLKKISVFKVQKKINPVFLVFAKFVKQFFSQFMYNTSKIFHKALEFLLFIYLIFFFSRMSYVRMLYNSNLLE